MIPNATTAASSYVSGRTRALRYLALAAGPAAWLAWHWLGPTDGLTPEAHRLAGVLLATVVWWLTEPIPLPAAALAGVVCCSLANVLPSDLKASEAVRQLLAPFAEPSVFFLIGGLFLGRAMTRHGLDRRLALAIIASPLAGRSPTTLLAAVGLAVAIVSMWISNTAATAMVFPITLSIIALLTPSQSGREQSTRSIDEMPPLTRSAYATALLLMTAYASTVGGVATPIGTTTNVVAKGFFDGFFHRRVEFLHWMAVGVPLMAIGYLVLVVWLRLLVGPARIDLTAVRSRLSYERAALGSLSRGEWNTLLVFVVAVALWIAPAALALLSWSEASAWLFRRLPEEVVALLVPVLLFLLPADAEHGSLRAEDFAKIDWGTILLFGAGLSLGALMSKTGLARAIGEATFAELNTDNVWLITAVSIAAGIVLSNFTSNAATATALIPLVHALCVSASIDPLPPLMGATLASSFGSALPVSTPPNAIVYGSGLIPSGRMIVAGLGFDIAGGIAIWIVLRIAFACGWSVFG